MKQIHLSLLGRNEREATPTDVMQPRKGMLFSLESYHVAYREVSSTIGLLLEAVVDRQAQTVEEYHSGSRHKRCRARRRVILPYRHTKFVWTNIHSCAILYSAHSHAQTRKELYLWVNLKIP